MNVEDQLRAAGRAVSDQVRDLPELDLRPEPAAGRARGRALRRWPGTGRWLKLVIKSNNGDPDYSEIMNVHAFGKALTSTPIANVSGTYRSAQFGDFHLSQTGAQLSGCYEHDGGLVHRLH